jgi:hypothetical protein
MLEKRQLQLCDLGRPFSVDSLADGRPMPKAPQPGANRSPIRRINGSSLEVRIKLDDTRIGKIKLRLLLQSDCDEVDSFVVAIWSRFERHLHCPKFVVAQAARDGLLRPLSHWVAIHQFKRVGPQDFGDGG